VSLFIIGFLACAAIYVYGPIVVDAWRNEDFRDDVLALIVGAGFLAILAFGLWLEAQI
jgi:hypothetical protein